LSLFGSGKLGGKKFYVQDFHNAYRFRPHVNPVRQKFQGYVNFILNREFFGSLYGDPANINEYRTTISSLVKTADLPSVNFQTEIKNSFNRKRIKLTGREYNPVTMQVYDTVGNEWISLLMKYFSYHFMDPRNQEQGDGPFRRDIGGSSAGKSFGGTDFAGSTFGKSDDSSMSKFTGKFDSNSDGLNIQKTSQFFERIDYVLYHGRKGIQYSLINPYLVRFTPSPLDYADSNAFEFGLEFQYEKFTVHSIANFDLGAEDNDRFDPSAKNMKGPAHELDPVMEDNFASGHLGEQNLEFLTPNDSDLMLTRSVQEEAIDTPPVEEDESTADGASEETTGDSAPDGEEVTDAQNNAEGDEDNNALVQVYGQAATFPDNAAPDGLFGESWFGDLLDASLSAAITGADIKDAALGSLGQSAIRYLDQNPDAVNNGVSGAVDAVRSVIAPEDQAEDPPEENTPTRGATP
jgi:hypothetical protein